jgi:hypothetical protein
MKSLESELRVYWSTTRTIALRERGRFEAIKPLNRRFLVAAAAEVHKPGASIGTAPGNKGRNHFLATKYARRLE